MCRLQWKDGSVSVKYYDFDSPIEACAFTQADDKRKLARDDGGPNSYGMYNLTRAKDILKNYDEYVRVMGLAKNSPLLSPKTVTGATLPRDSRPL